jgi:hypothetical protein
VLIYHPRTLLGNAFKDTATTGDDAPVEIAPTGKPGALKLKLLVRDKPQPDSEITVILPDATQKKLKTDATGETELLTQPGRYGAWARYWEPAPGERDGKKYAEVRHYATLVFDAGTEAPSSPNTTRSGITASYFAALPQATASFGAVANDGWLYVYGGHIAPTHSYSTAAVSGQFARLNLAHPMKWEPLQGGPPLQGMNLAAYQGRIYRIGGMAPRNKPGDPEANFSSADAARFDVASGKWEPLPPLPDPRSSHDVVVIGDKLIVTGGWTLKGSDRTEWRDTLNVLDLAAPQPAWRSIPQPFKRRALIAVAFSGQMYVLGGFDDHGKVLHAVSIYNPDSEAWTNGPPLPGDELNGFSPAACVVDGALYVSVADGTIYRLNASRQTWEKSGHATPRVAHRMVADGKNILVMGGAAKGHNLDSIESNLTAAR